MLDLDEAEASLAPRWSRFAAIARANTAKVLDAFREARIGDHHFAGTTGYGHDDLGREALETVFARVFKAEAALVRAQFASGTHAIATALFGALAPGDELLYVTGHPYDTLEEVIGLRGEGQGSLLDWGVSYREVPQGADGRVDLPAIKASVTAKTRVVAIQRSRGYDWRSSVAIADIARIAKVVREVSPTVTIFVDNCYGEFTETLEPLEAGCDLIAGSLIKNPGGGIVPSGGYVAGRADLVHRAACRLTAPGIGRAGGATESHRLLFQGLFLAPSVVESALRGASLAAWAFERMGYAVSPGAFDERTDIIQAIRFGDAEALIAFCRAIQAASPVNAYVSPIPDVVPGYEDNVVMAGGTFIEGSTIELSADGPLREPYVAYWQGGLSYSHCRIALERAVAAIAAKCPA